MKAETGKIVIKDKVYFEYYKLEKPPERKMTGDCFLDYGYIKEKEAYEASKQLIEVSNVFWGELSEKWFYEDPLSDTDVVKNNQSCKAEVIDKAKIIELL